MGHVVLDVGLSFLAVEHVVGRIVDQQRAEADRFQG